MTNKLIQRIIFDIILVGLIFLPVFTGLYLWFIFLRSTPELATPTLSIPKFDEKGLNELVKKSSARHFFSPKQEISTSQGQFGLRDPFN